MKFYSLVSFLTLFGFCNAQGPYLPDADTPGTNAVHYQDESIIAWASGCEVTRGLQDIAINNGVYADFGIDADGVGAVGDNGIVSLGDGGSAILTFEEPIFNGPGVDFAVFENGFNNTFLELAFVEVSSDGINYVRFPSISLTQIDVQVDGFGDVDPTNVYNLAGKYKARYGTPFDLEELKDDPLLNVDNITHIKLIDVVGSIDDAYASLDSQGNKINDPYATPFPSSGFDLDAIGVMHTTVSVKYKNQLSIEMYPNPAHDFLTISVSNNESCTVCFIDLLGKVVFEKRIPYGKTKINLSIFKSGLYDTLLVFEDKVISKRLLIE